MSDVVGLASLEGWIEKRREVLDEPGHVAPVVLWIDEVEKAFAAGDSSQDGAAVKRVARSVASGMEIG